MLDETNDAELVENIKVEMTIAAQTGQKAPDPSWLNDDEWKTILSMKSRNERLQGSFVGFWIQTLYWAMLACSIHRIPVFVVFEDEQQTSKGVLNQLPQ